MKLFATISAILVGVYMIVFLLIIACEYTFRLVDLALRWLP